MHQATNSCQFSPAATRSRTWPPSSRCSKIPLIATFNTSPGRCAWSTTLLPSPKGNTGKLRALAHCSKFCKSAKDSTRANHCAVEVRRRVLKQLRENEASATMSQPTNRLRARSRSSSVSTPAGTDSAASEILMVCPLSSARSCSNDSKVSVTDGGHWVNACKNPQR